LLAACNSMISYGSLLLFAAVTYWAPQFFAAHCGLLLFSQWADFLHFYCVFRHELPNLSVVPDHFVILFYSCDILYMNLFSDD
jgi:hypothetical protein